MGWDRCSVKEAQVPIDYGGTTAAPFARQILDESLGLLGVERRGEENSAEALVPDVRGLTIAEARRKLTEEGFSTLDDGASTVVLDQLPPPGAKLVTGGHVMLYTASSSQLTAEELVCVPDLLGMNDVECARLLRRRGLLISMAGTGLCVTQSPAAGEYVQPGKTVHVVFSGED